MLEVLNDGRDHPMLTTGERKQHAIHQAGGINLYYEEAGSGPPLLFINGLGLSTRSWMYQVDYFSRKFRVITFDPRGHGKSGKPPGPYSIEQFASDTAGLIRSLDLPPAHVAGLSMGGMIGFQLAVNSPDLVRSLVIVNSGPEFILRTLRQKVEMAKREFILNILGVRRMGAVLSRRLFPKPEQKRLRSFMARLWAENDKRAYRDSLRALKGWSVVGRLKDIRSPTLIVTADQDYTPLVYKQWYANQIPGAELAVISDSRHATPVDQPDRFNHVVMEFLAKHS